jgi:hypothetical protein
LKTSKTSSGNGASKPPPGYEAALFRTVTESRGLSLGDRACLALGRHLSLPVLTNRQGLGRARSRSRSQAVALMTFERSRYGDEAANTEGRGFNAPRGCCSKSSSSRLYDVPEALYAVLVLVGGGVVDHILRYQLV